METPVGWLPTITASRLALSPPRFGVIPQELGPMCTLQRPRWIVSVTLDRIMHLLLITVHVV